MIDVPKFSYHSQDITHLPWSDRPSILSIRYHTITNSEMLRSNNKVRLLVVYLQLSDGKELLETCRTKFFLRHLLFIDWSLQFH